MPEEDEIPSIQLFAGEMGDTIVETWQVANGLQRISAMYLSLKRKDKSKTMMKIMEIYLDQFFDNMMDEQRKKIEKYNQHVKDKVKSSESTREERWRRRMEIFEK